MEKLKYEYSDFNKAEENNRMIDRIKKNNLCLGCGLCSSVLGKDKCEMALTEKGFYEPKVKQPTTAKENKIVKQLCPGIHVETTPHEGVWGSMRSIAEAWSANSEIRHKAASGGVITSLAIYLVEQHKVDSILQVGVCDDSYLYNELKVSRSRGDILHNAQSRYAPALVFDKIKQILDSSAETYAFIGKPCDMAAMQNFCRKYPQYSQRIKYYLSIFCAGMPSYNATIKTWQQSGHADAPLKLKYRGEGWPGNFKAEFADGSDYQITYNESWGTVLNRHLAFRCKICPDGIGMLADIAVGDSWNTKDGYPDFTESEGRCFCMIRTNNGLSLFNEAVKNGYIESNNLSVNHIQEMQKYQYERRKLSGWRILPVQLFSGFILNFKGLSIVKQALTAQMKVGIRNMLGTIRRIRNNGK